MLKGCHDEVLSYNMYLCWLPKGLFDSLMSNMGIIMQGYIVYAMINAEAIVTRWLLKIIYYLYGYHFVLI